MSKQEIHVLLAGPEKGKSTGISSLVQNLMKALPSAIKADLFSSDFYQEAVAEGGYVDHDMPLTNESLQELSCKLRHSDIVHIHLMSRLGEVKQAVTIAEVAKEKDVKLIVHFHCTIEEFHNCREKEQKKVMDKLMSMTDLVIVQNQLSLKFIENNYSNAVSYLPNFIKNVPAQVQYDSVKRVVAIGNVERKKGAYDIVELARLFPTLEFYLVGGIEPSFQEKAQEDGFLPSNVVLAGKKTQEELVDIWQSASLFLFPTYYMEGFSMSLLEAMSNGLPCLISNQKSSMEILQDPTGRQVFCVGDVKDMAKKLQYFCNLSSKDLREIGETNRKIVLSNYTADIVANSLVRLYQEVINL
jgi:glycosyltransferase